jgi:hypothetical protein
MIPKENVITEVEVNTGIYKIQTWAWSRKASYSVHLNKDISQLWIVFV